MVTSLTVPYPSFLVMSVFLAVDCSLLQAKSLFKKENVCAFMTHL